MHKEKEKEKQSHTHTHTLSLWINVLQTDITITDYHLSVNTSSLKSRSSKSRWEQALPRFFGRWLLLVLWTPPWCSSAVRHAGGWNWSQCSSTPLGIFSFHTLNIYLDSQEKVWRDGSLPRPSSSALSSVPRLCFGEKEERWKDEEEFLICSLASL